MVEFPEVPRRAFIAGVGAGLAGCSAPSRSGPSPPFTLSERSDLSPTSGTRWPLARFDARNSGRNREVAGPGPKAAIAWQTGFAHDEVRFTGAPVTDGENLYVPSARNRDFYALDANTGDTNWRFSCKNDLQFAGALGKDEVVLADGDDIVALTTTGDRAWRTSVSESLSQPVVSDRTVYAGTTDSDGSLYATDLDTGSIRWTAKAPLTVFPPCVLEDRILVYGDDEILAYDRDGVERWSHETSYGSIQTPLLATSDALYVAQERESDGTSVVVTLSTEGRKKREVHLEKQIGGHLALTADRVVAPTWDGELLALDRRELDTGWRYRPDRRVYSAATAKFAPVSDGDYVYYNGPDGRLHAIALESGRPSWRTGENHHTTVSPVLSSDTLFSGGPRSLYAVTRDDSKAK